MKIYYFVLLLVSLLGQLTAQPISKHESDPVGLLGQQRRDLHTQSRRTLASEEANNATTESAVCDQVNTQTHFGLDEVLTNVSDTGIVSNAFDCCELCQLIPQCQAWNRNRTSGECILGYSTDDHLIGGGDLDFDAGFIWGRIHSIALTPPSGTDGQPCRVNTGVRYPRGHRVGQGRVQEPVDCCEICRGSNNCRSWYHTSRRARCILNGNTPHALSASDEYTGGTV